jgi:hypothetical protein
MKYLFLIPLLFLLAPSAFSNSSGIYGTGGDQVTVFVKLTPGPVHDDLSCRFTHNGASATATDAIPDPDGDGKDVLTTPDTTAGGKTYRFKDGKCQVKDAAGFWHTLKKQKTKRNSGSSVRAQGGGGIAIGEEGSSLPQFVPPQKL